jgi:spermidine synthase
MSGGRHRGDEAGRGQRTWPDRVELLADLDRPGAWMLLVDDIAQSHVDLDDPRHLELEYVRRIGHVVDLAAPAGAPLRVLHLGGGGLTLARYVAATRPGSVQLAVESDPEVAGLVRRRLPLRPPGRARAGSWRIDLRVGDARAALEQLSDGSFDIVIADVFDGAATPAHVTSAEFTREAARVLAGSGIYAVNVSDGPPLAHARARIATIRSVFRHACVIAEPGVLRGRRFGNLVVAATAQELPIPALTRLAASDPVPARLLAGAAVEQFVAGTAPITDAGAEPSRAPPPDAPA